MTQPANPVPVTLAAALRIALAVLGPVAVQHGWLGQSDLPNAAALITSVAAAGWGLWKTHERQTRLVNSTNGRIQP